MFSFLKSSKKNKEPVKVKVEKRWKLEFKIQEKDGKSYNIWYTSKEIRPLFKFYLWYMKRESPFYNMEYKNGMKLFYRDEIFSISLNKVDVTIEQ